MTRTTASVGFASITFSHNGHLFARLCPTTSAAHLTISSTLAGFAIETSDGSPMLNALPGATTHLMRDNGYAEFPTSCAPHLDPTAQLELRNAEQQMLCNSLSDPMLRTIFGADPTPGYSRSVAGLACTAGYPLASTCTSRRRNCDTQIKISS